MQHKINNVQYMANKSKIQYLFLMYKLYCLIDKKDMDTHF